MERLTVFSDRLAQFACDIELIYYHPIANLLKFIHSSRWQISKIKWCWFSSQSTRDSSHNSTLYTELLLNIVLGICNVKRNKTWLQTGFMCWRSRHIHTYIDRSLLCTLVRTVLLEHSRVKAQEKPCVFHWKTTVEPHLRLPVVSVRKMTHLVFASCSSSLWPCCFGPQLCEKPSREVTVSHLRLMTMPWGSRYPRTLQSVLYFQGGTSLKIYSKWGILIK